MYTLPQLPYAYDALEPEIDKKTLEIHHGKHHQTYVNNLNNALSNHPQLFEIPLEVLLNDLSVVPDDIRTAVANNGGGHYNHSFYWKILDPNKRPLNPQSIIAKALDNDFGSYENFKKAFTASAITQFGSGYAWLVVTPENLLKVVQTANQDVPFKSGKPILVIDVWEHAYYLKYQNRRAEYVENFFNIINWDQVESFYMECLSE